MLIKLCGMMCEADVRAALSVRPDYIGFILCDRFRRYISPDDVLRIRKKIGWSYDLTANPADRHTEYMGEKTKAVGVFVDQDPDKIIHLLDTGVIDVAQLHGDEPDEHIIKIKDQTGKPVIKAFRIENEEDVIRAEASPADMILLDAGTGAGETFDWSLVQNVSRDFFLAGGLNPDNIVAAIEQVHPYGVDVSSGIETDGKKDPKKMKLFTERINLYNAK